MGLLSKGTPLSWEDTKKNAWIVHRDGILQFIALYNKFKDRKGYTLKWGDEVSQALGRTAGLQSCSAGSEHRPCTHRQSVALMAKYAFSLLSLFVVRLKAVKNHDNNI